MTPTTKTDIVIFLKNKQLLAGTIHIRYLIYQKATYGKKTKESDFSTLATKLRFWSIFPDRRSYFISWTGTGYEMEDRQVMKVLSFRLNHFVPKMIPEIPKISLINVWERYQVPSNSIFRNTTHVMKDKRVET